MKIRSGINPATISAITMMLQPHIPEISPQSLIAALKNYGNSPETKKCSAQRPLTRASYTAHHLAVYEKRQVTQNLFISTQCQGGSGKRKCSFTMSRLNFRDLIEQLLSSIFRPVTKREILLNTVSLFFTAKYLLGENGFMIVLAEFANCNGL